MKLWFFTSIYINKSHKFPAQIPNIYFILKNKISAINEVEDEEKNQPLVEEPINNGDISSAKIKLLYILTVGGVLLIVFLVAIIVIFIGGNSKNSEQEKDNKNETIPDIDPYLNSTFDAVYENLNEGEEVKLFNEYLIDKISYMIIDNEAVNISNLYTFNKTGEHKVIIKLKNNQILESTEEMFKDCIYLNDIYFKNFNTENVKNGNLHFTARELSCPRTVR